MPCPNRSGCSSRPPPTGLLSLVRGAAQRQPGKSHVTTPEPHAGRTPDGKPGAGTLGLALWRHAGKDRVLGFRSPSYPTIPAFSCRGIRKRSEVSNKQSEAQIEVELDRRDGYALRGLSFGARAPSAGGAVQSSGGEDGLSKTLGNPIRRVEWTAQLVVELSDRAARRRRGCATRIFGKRLRSGSKKARVATSGG